MPIVSDDISDDYDSYDVDLSLASHQVDVLVKRDDDESFTLVSWQLSLHNGRWLIDSMNVT